MLFLMLIAVLFLASAGSFLAVRRRRQQPRVPYRPPAQPRPPTVRSAIQKREHEELIAAIEAYLRAQITAPRREE